jgi:hypothetical protein
MPDDKYLLSGTLTLNMVLARVQHAIEQKSPSYFDCGEIYHLRIAGDDLRAWVDVCTVDVIGLYIDNRPPLARELVPRLIPVARLILFMLDPGGVLVVESDNAMFEKCPELLEFRRKLKARLQEWFPRQISDLNSPGDDARDGGEITWNQSAIRKLLTAAFDDEKIIALCSDHFHPVYEDFGSGMSKGQKIERLLDYCLRHEKMEQLLEMIQKHNPTQYTRFEGRLKE